MSKLVKLRKLSNCSSTSFDRWLTELGLKELLGVGYLRVLVKILIHVASLRRGGVRIETLGHRILTWTVACLE